MSAPDDEVHYQLYKLLAFAIQELSYFASEDHINDCLQLPHSSHILTNRARMAVERIEMQNPHFFSGYVRYRRGTLYPELPEAPGTTEPLSHEVTEAVSGFSDQIKER